MALGDFDTVDVAKKSLSQANRFSRSPYIARQPSILDRLASRALTGRHLPIEVHQHYQQEVHLVWRFDRDGVESAACLARAFVRCGDVIMFNHYIRRRMLQGICTCVCGGIARDFSDRYIRCIRAPPFLHLAMHPHTPPWCYSAHAHCWCNVTYIEYLCRYWTTVGRILTA